METIVTELPEKQWDIPHRVAFQCSHVLNRAAVGIFQAIPHRGYVRVNQTLARILGYNSPEQLQASVTNKGEQLYVDPRRYAELMNLLQERHWIKHFESRVYRQDGEIIWIREHLRLICDRDGRPLGYQGIVEPLSAPQQTREPDGVGETTQLLSMVSHELRASLTVISATNDLLKLHSQKMTPEQRLKYFEKIGETVKTTTELIDGFLCLGRAESGRENRKLVPVCFASLCQDVWQDVAGISGKTHHFVRTTTTENAQLTSDPTLLRQILVNLLGNAVKYSPSGSTISCDWNTVKGQFVFRIKDRGIGIPEADLENLFNLFHRATNVSNASGTGVGLAIVKRAVDLLGGQIWVASEVGVGTVFTIAMPQCAATETIEDLSKTA
ncbi:PAS domain-containing sensor histidine kinase [Phormidium sp. CCY1219]|nr:PAS domain-containing sensor histidine kinase [Phormidium sp. CCY1219]